MSEAASPKLLQRTFWPKRDAKQFFDLVNSRPWSVDLFTIFTKPRAIKKIVLVFISLKRYIFGRKAKILMKIFHPIVSCNTRNVEIANELNWFAY